MTDTFLKASINKSLMEVDGLVGLPNGVKPEPMTYNLGKINEYLKKTGKEFKELSDSELKRFEI
jgi:hypothetical protein